MFKRIRFSRKVVLIGGGILLLGGASGVAAIVVGKDQLFGPSEVVQNGLECKTAQTVKIKKNGSVWIRKFVRTEGGDGPERMKTALRVAKAIYDKDHPDLVQVSVLDAKGPQMRADMRGRSIAAQAVYIADISKLPEGAASQNYSAYYYDGAVADDGQFYGLRIDLPVEDAKAITASLTEFGDCADPEPPADAHGVPAGGHGAPAGHGAEASGGHGESKESDSHGAEAKASDGHGAENGAHEGGEKPAEGGHDAPANADGSGNGSAEPLLTSTPDKSESMFSFGYIKSLLFGKGETTAVAAEQPAAEGHGEPAAAEGHGDAPASDAPSEATGHSASAVAEEPATQDAPSAEAAGGHDTPAAQDTSGHAAASGSDHAAEAPKPEH